MVLDYSERKPVSKNRPRKQPVGVFVFVLIGAVAVSFGAGFLAGRLFSRPVRSGGSQSSPLQESAKIGTPVPQPAAPQQPNPEATAGKTVDPPLTFYETLPKGGKAVIGTGLNPKKPEPASPSKPAAVPPPTPQRQEGQKPALPAAKPDDLKEQHPAPADQAKKGGSAASDPSKPAAAGGGRFCVQVASSQDRKDAEAIRSKMSEKGLPAYIVESNVKEKGTWFRVRIGKHLTQQAAAELAGKAGKGALIISE